MLSQAGASTFRLEYPRHWTRCVHELLSGSITSAVCVWWAGEVQCLLQASHASASCWRGGVAEAFVVVLSW